MTGWDLLVEVESWQPASSDNADGGADSLANIISPGWFRALGTPLVAGREFTDRDGRDAPPIVVVNEAFARQFLPGASALSRTITIRGMGPEATPRTVVGVAADALWSLRDPVPPILYVPLAQADDESLELRVEEQGLTLGVRAASGAPDLLTTRIAAALRTVDPRLTLTFRSPAQHMDPRVPRGAHRPDHGLAFGAVRLRRLAKALARRKPGTTTPGPDRSPALRARV